MGASRFRAAMRGSCLLIASMLALFALAAGPAQHVRAATVTVDSATDAVHSPGCADDGTTSPCSLRDAIIYANAHPNTTISLPAGTYYLTIGRTSGDDATSGDLNTTANMTIIGAGADTTIIDGSTMSPPGRIFYNSVGSVNNPSLSITGVTIRGGTAPGAGCPQTNDCFDGGGIFNRGTVSLTDVWVTNNSASVGGGIANRTTGATLTLNRTTISGNSAATSGCGVTGGPCGGGIYNQVGTVTATNSTISGNTGGGIISQGANNSFTNSTIAANTGGMGLNSDNGRGGYTVTNSIITDGCDTTVATDGLHNLDAGTSCGFTDATDRSGVNPSLGPLRVNAPGHTPTHAIKTGSAALDKIPSGANCPTTDQRGVTRPQPVGGLCDIGAYELTQPAATGFAATGFPSSTRAGESHTFTVTAKDASNATATTYSGIVHFSSSDTAASLPADSALTNGVGTFSVTLRTPGTQSITVTDTEDNTITGTQSSITVTQTASTLVITGLPPTATAGAANNFTVTAQDQFGATVTGYTGTVRFTSSDAAASIPADTALTNGVGTFSVTFRTAGNQTLSVTDAADGSITGSQPITVTPNAASSFTIVDYPSPTTAGESHSFTVVARDQSNNVATGYTGTVHFTSSDTQASLPGDYTFTASDQGKHVFTATFKTAGAQRITATDAAGTAITGMQGTIAVAAGPATQLALSGPSNATAGASLSITITAKDAFNNTATSYTGTVRFASTDGQAALPADYPFIPGDGGVRTFSVTLKTAGRRSITATDTASGTITGTLSAIVVNPASAATLVVTGFPSPSTAGAPGNVTVTARDAFGNIATGYTGTIQLTSSDPQAALPGNDTFVAADNGVHTVSNTLTLKTAGTQSITVRDASTPTITGTQSGITIVAASAASLVVTGYPASTTTNASNGFIVFAKDAFGNTAPSYGGTVRFTSSDAAATLPANYTFTGVDAGAHLFAATMKTTGTQSLTTSDTNSPTITGTQSGITVTAGAAASSTVATGTNQSIRVNTAFGIALAVTVTDAAHNPVPNATVTFDAPASGASGTFPGGVHTVNATTDAGGIATAPTFTANTTAGAYTVSASATGVATPATFNLTNTPGNAASIAITNLPNPTTAGANITFTLTARDAFGNIATGYRGTVTFSLSDGAGTKPGNYAFTAGDNGVRTFPATLKTIGSQSLTATDTGNGAITATQSTQVNPGAAASAVVANYPSPIAINAAAGFTVVVRDAFGNTASGYTGTVHFTSTDSQASLPANYAFTGADQGAHSFSATFKTPGTQSITATDTVTSTITGTQSAISVITVTPKSINVTTGNNQSVTVHTAFGIAFAVTVTDAASNPVPNVTVTFVAPASGPSGTFPGDVHAVNVTTNASGVATAPTFTANTAVGGYNVSASVGGVAAPVSFSLTNTPGVAASFVLGGLPNTIQAGTPLTITLTAKDAFGNTATGYRGTVTFILSDAAGTRPANYTFTAGDAGVHTFSGVVLKTLGTQSLAVTDTAAVIVSAGEPVQVTPGPAATVALMNFPSPVAAGSTAGFTVVVRDAFGNTASGYVGTVRFSSSDNAAILPANYTFTAGDAGVRSFTVTLKTPGSHSLTATDTTTGTLTGAQTGITVTTAAAVHLVVTASATASAGAVFSVAITAKDGLNNTVTSYTRTIRFTSSDTQAALPGDYTFVAADNGTHTFAVTFKLAGSQTLTVTDLGDGTISGAAAVAVSGPTLAGVSPISGPPADGTTITLTGTNLQGASVTIGGAACAGIQVNGAGTSLTCTVPAHSDGTVDITVTTSDGSATLAHAFTYVTPGSVGPPAARPSPGGSSGSGGGSPAVSPTGR